MKIFLTGATGFIGSHFTKEVVSAGYNLTALNRNNDVSLSDDLSDIEWLQKPMDQLSVNDLVGHDVLVHLASVGVSPKKASSRDLIYWNVEVLMKLLESSLEAGIKRIVIAGSFAEYGKSSEDYEFIPTSAPLQPTSLYAASKAAGFLLANTFAMQNNIEICYLRIFSVFGEGQYEKNFWPALVKAAKSGDDFPMTEGEQVRDYIHVSDVCKVMLNACFNTKILKGLPLVLNVGTGHPVSMRQFAELWWRQLDAEGELLFGALPYRDNECMRFVPKL